MKEKHRERHTKHFFRNGKNKTSRENMERRDEISSTHW